MAVYRKKQPVRRPVRRGWKRHARTGMFLFAFALVAVTVGVILPHAGVMSAAAEGSTLTEKIFTTVQNKNLPVEILLDLDAEKIVTLRDLTPEWWL